MSEYKYNWFEIKEACNNIFNKIKLEKTMYSGDWVKEIYSNNLPKAIDDALTICAVYQVDHTDKDVRVLRDGFFQLFDHGMIVVPHDKQKES